MSVIEASIDHDTEDTNYAGNESLYEAAAAGEVALVSELLESGANPNFVSTDSYGQWTALHAACANNRPEIVRILVESNANILAEDRQGYTPLHTACSYGYMECLEALKPCKDLLREVITSETMGSSSPLGLAIENEKLDAVKYLLIEFDVTLTKGVLTDSLLMLCCSKGDLKFVKKLINEFHCEPNDSKDAVLQLSCETGALELTKLMNTEYKCVATADNLVSACEKNHRDIVAYLLADMYCDPNQVNSFGQTPLTKAKDRKVLQLLLKHGAVAKEAYAYHRRSMGLLTSKNPLENPVKMFVIGFGGEGKSTLVEAMQHEKLRGSAALKAVTGVSEQTAGIVPKIFESKLYGCVQFFDCAGQETFHSSHASIIKTCVLSSPPVFILVTGLHKSDDDTKDSIAYWLNTVANQCVKMEGKAPLIVVGSHLDQARPEDVDRKKKIVSRIAEKYLQLKFTKFVAMDCRYPDSTGMKQLREVVGKACNSLRSNLSVSLNSHMFLIHLLDKHREENCTTVECVQSEIEDLSQDHSKKDKTNLLFIPTETARLVEICSQLSDKGHILFLRNHDRAEKSFIIIDKTVLMEKVNGTMFAPTTFKEHCQLATSTGIVPKSRLVEHFSGTSIDMIVGFLSHHELAVQIEDKEVLSLIKKQVVKLGAHDSHEDETYLFCPGLIRLEADERIWKQHDQKNFHFGWVIFCSKDDQFFSGQLFQVLLLRLALNLKLAISIDSSIPSLQQYCSVWKTGIHWQTNDNISIVVELGEYSRSIMLLMRTEKMSLEFMQLRSDIINKIRKAIKEICRLFKVSEFLIHPSELASYPPPLFSQLQNEEKLFSFERLAESVVECSKRVVNLHNFISISELLQGEVYTGLGENLLQALFNEKQSMFTEKVSNRILETIASIWKNQSSLMYEVMRALSTRQQPLAVNNHILNAILTDWRETTEGSLKLLRTILDTLSVFAGKNVLELADVKLKAFSDEKLHSSQEVTSTYCTEQQPVSSCQQLNLQDTDISPNNTVSNGISLISTNTSQSQYIILKHSRPSQLFTPSPNQTPSPQSIGSSFRLSSLPEETSCSPTEEHIETDFGANQASLKSHSSTEQDHTRSTSAQSFHLSLTIESPVVSSAPGPSSGRSYSLPGHTSLPSPSSLMQRRSNSLPSGSQTIQVAPTINIHVNSANTCAVQSPTTPTPRDEELIETARKTGNLSIHHLKLLKDRLLDARCEWKHLGLELGIDYFSLKEVEKENRGNVEDCFSTMLSKFLSQDTPSPPHVTTLVEALKSRPVDHQSLVNKINDLLPEDLLESSITT